MVTEVGALGEELAHFKRQALDPLDQSRRRRPLVVALLPNCLRACGSRDADVDLQPTRQFRVAGPRAAAIRDASGDTDPSLTARAKAALRAMFGK